jgi:hypothetical protein
MIARVLPHFEVVGHDHLYWELSRLQYVEPSLPVDHSTVCVGRQEVNGIQSVYGGEIGSALWAANISRSNSLNISSLTVTLLPPLPKLS